MCGVTGLEENDFKGYERGLAFAKEGCEAGNG